jgi:uncharacterized RDD family membrane protein YckC
VAVAPGRTRLRASGGDYLVILAWLAFLTLVGVAVRRLLPPVSGGMSLLAADTAAFAFSVLPVWVYLTLTEAGAGQATWGKRRSGLRVVGVDGEHPGWRRIALRNGVKLLPWQLAHVSVARAIVGADEPIVMATTYALSLVLPAVSIWLAWRDPLGRSLHDRVAATLVVRA